MMRLASFAWLCSLAALLPASAFAHSFEPCLLAIHERTLHDYDVVWRPPSSAAGYNLSSLDITPQFPASCVSTIRQEAGAGDLEPTRIWQLRCRDGLRGTTLSIPGIDATPLDVVIRVVWLDGTIDTTVLRSGDSSYELRQGSGAALPLASARYLRLGVEHILLGFDHLVFVLALFLLASNTPRLVKMITAFTLGHSLTLALATFGLLALPTPLSEAWIALSIVFVARELVAGETPETRSSWAHSWVVAIAFGLLHGLGFASALDQFGLDRQHVLPALLGFNLGVELGQIAFVVLLLVLARGLRPLTRMRVLRPLLPYAIGSVACLWLFERVARFALP